MSRFRGHSRKLLLRIAPPCLPENSEKICLPQNGHSDSVFRKNRHRATAPVTTATTSAPQPKTTHSRRDTTEQEPVPWRGFELTFKTLVFFTSYKSGGPKSGPATSWGYSTVRHLIDTSYPKIMASNGPFSVGVAQHATPMLNTPKFTGTSFPLTASFPVASYTYGTTYRRSQCCIYNPWYTDIKALVLFQFRGSSYKEKTHATERDRRPA